MKKNTRIKFKRLSRFLKILSPFLIINGLILNANANIISSVKPIAFITQAISDGVTNTDILLPDGTSPHTYSLKPSDLAKIKTAELIIWVGEDLETFMPTVLKNIDKNKQIELMDIPTIKSLLRTSTNNHDQQKTHTHNNDSDHDHHGEYDEHIWLSPKIANEIAQAVHDLSLIHI